MSVLSETLTRVHGSIEVQSDQRVSSSFSRPTASTSEYRTHLRVSSCFNMGDSEVSHFSDDNEIEIIMDSSVRRK